ncbi:MAG TPA: PBP1A family penicillin-binding protein [Rhizomicrobium sp.]
MSFQLPTPDNETLRKALAIAHRLIPYFTIAVTVLAVPLALLYLLPTILGWFAPPLDPNIDLYAVNRPVAFTFLDASGHEIGHRGAVVGERLQLEDMPDYLPAAFVAVEDRRFYTNPGIDPRGLLRALFTDLRAGHWVQGGSTITQQTAKIVYTAQQRTFSRKLTELIDAAGLEKTLSKKQILELYLNRLYLGSAAYGVDAAAHVYFGVSARHVTLAQAAMLATLTRAPSVFSPRRDLARAQERASRVLKVMVETGAITQAQADDARAHPAIVSDRASVDARNFFLDTAALEAARYVSQNNTDLIVHTTLEPRIQEAARLAAIRTLRKSGKRDRVHEAAIVVMKPDGAVSALIGGTDYDSSVFNRATQARRQPGSAFKPFVYLAALESGITPWDLRDDQPVDINGWTPTNYGGRQYGTLTLADALAHSVNTITANLAQEVGLPAVVAAAQRCGITSPLVANASLALGTSEVTPLEITTAYAAFANGGNRVYPYFVTGVDDASGRILYRRQAPQPQRIIASHVDRDLVAMLYGVVTSGTGRSAALAGHEAAGKTGTTQDYRDAWFVGFTTDYVTAVWVGNDDNAAMRGVTGGTLPAVIWHDTMTAAEHGLAATPLDRSPPQPPAATGLFENGESALPGAGDDESTPGASIDATGGAPAAPSSEQSQPKPHHGFLGWLFGNDDDDNNPPPPPRGSDDN